MTDFADLMRSVPGSYAGVWYLIPNEESVNSLGQLWSGDKDGSHPFVLIAEFDPNLPVPARGRSTTVKSRFSHQPHPRQHEATCCITKPGWIRVYWALSPEAIRDDRYSCVEPDPSVTKRLEEDRA